MDMYRVICCSRKCKTLCTDAAAHCKRKGVREEDWAALDLKTLLSGLDKRALASMRAPSRSGISESSQQRGGAGPGPQVKLPNSRKPLAMNGKVTEASKAQSVGKEEMRRRDHEHAQVTALPDMGCRSSHHSDTAMS